MEIFLQKICLALLVCMSFLALLVCMWEVSPSVRYLVGMSSLKSFVNVAVIILP